MTARVSRPPARRLIGRISRSAQEESSELSSRRRQRNWAYRRRCQRPEKPIESSKVNASCVSAIANLLAREAELPNLSALGSKLQRKAIMRVVRYLPHAALCLLSLGVAACFGHHSADEAVIDVEPAVQEDSTSERDDSQTNEDERDAGAPRDAGRIDAGTPRDAGRDAGSADSCAQETDIVARLLCTATTDGGIEGIIGGLLGGGMTGMNCARETDPIALLLCTATGTGGTGIEGIIGGLLGGGGIGTLLGDGGVERVLTDVLVEVVRGVLDDLVGALFGGGDGGSGGLFGGRTRQTNRALVSTKSRSVEDLIRSAEECEKPSPDDLLTRALCARQALDAFSAARK